MRAMYRCNRCAHFFEADYDDARNGDLRPCLECGGWGVAGDEDMFPEGTMRVVDTVFLREDVPGFGVVR